MSHMPVLTVRSKTLLLSHFSRVWLFKTLWTVACQAPLYMGILQAEYWSGLPCPPPGHLPNLKMEPTSLMSPELAGMYFKTSATWEAFIQDTRINYKGMDRKEYVTCYPKFHGTKGKKKAWMSCKEKKKKKTRKWCLRNLDIFFITLPKPSQEWLTPHIPEVVYTSESSVQFSSVTQSCMTLRHSC